MASYEVLIDEEERGPIITADSAKLALVQALAEAIQWVLRGDWPEDGCTITISVVKGGVTVPQSAEAKRSASQRTKRKV